MLDTPVKKSTLHKEAPIFKIVNVFLHKDASTPAFSPWVSSQIPN